MAQNGCWLVFGDVHDDIARLDEIPELADAVGAIVSGDITFAGGSARALRVLEPVAARVPRLLAQIGNMDKAEVTGVLDGRGWNLHARARELFPGIVALGVGGSTPTPFNTPSEFSEEDMRGFLERGLAEARVLSAQSGEIGASLVLVSHTPPRGTACDRLGNGASAGSSAVRAFIEERRPALCLCGHIHEARARDRIGNTLIINPGTLSDGGYVVLRREDGPAGPRPVAELKILRPMKGLF
ncbi:MAG: metallophosphoesterase family protein [Desulfovibrio sp.]|nr:metallophosphoesterase family protein [Desulfovibrio sp.]